MMGKQRVKPKVEKSDDGPTKGKARVEKSVTTRVCFGGRVRRAD